MKRRTVAAALALGAAPAWSQVKPTPAALVAAYEGADRQERLVAGARKEGTLNLYSSIAAADVSLFTGQFEQLYGVKVNVWRAANDKVLQRVIGEQAAGRHEADAIQIASLELEALARENLLQALRVPVQAQLIAQAVPRHRLWAAHYLNVWVQAYNTQKVRKEDLPKTYADLLHPRWKGKLGIEAKNEEWFFTVVEGMGEAAGLKFFRDLVSTNGLSARAGHSLLNNLVVAGDVPLALTVYNYMPEQARQKGAPIDWFVIEPAIARANGVAVSRQSQRPHAAVLFYEFVLGEDMQRLMAKNGYVPTHRGVESPLKQVTIKLVDTEAALNAADKWAATFEAIIKGGK